MHLSDNISVKENTKSESYKFELPTRVTKLEPVFLFSFEIDQNKTNNILNVELNPNLFEQTGKSKLVKKFKFNNEQYFRFNKEEFSNYFIEGEIQLLDFTPNQNGKSCFVSITYGNSDEALHFIKGKFKLTENEN